MNLSINRLTFLKDNGILICQDSALFRGGLFFEIYFVRLTEQAVSTL